VWLKGGRIVEEYAHEHAEIYYHVPSELEKQVGVWILRAGRNLAKANYHVGPRFITCYSLHFIQSGEVYFRYREREITLKKGDIFLMFPYETYEYLVKPSDHPLRMRWLAFEGGLISDLLAGTGLSPEMPYANKHNSKLLQECMEQILDSLRVQRSPAMLRTAYVFELIHGLSGSNLNRIGFEGQHAWMKQSKLYMDAHYAEGITVEQTAKAIGLSRAHFTKSFTRQTGIKPGQYLQSLRMKEACRMLGQTQFSITEIALSVGYADLFSFSRAFTKFYGLTPSTYRDGK
jgi:AraC-like DNA-binding protein